jgi:hypothetical protein
MTLSHAMIDQPVAETIKFLNAVKSQYANVLINGSLRIPFVNEEDKLMVIERFSGEEHLYFIFNFDDKAHKYILSSEGRVDKVVIIPPYKAEIAYFKIGASEKSLTAVNLYDAQSVLLEL